MDDTRKLFKDMRSILEQKTPHTFESLIFGSESEHRNPEFDEGMPTEAPIETNDNEKVAQEVSPVDGEVKPIIDQIRMLTIQGIAKLAKNPTSESYAFLKKILALVDKTIENGGIKSESGSNI